MASQVNECVLQGSRRRGGGRRRRGGRRRGGRGRAKVLRSAHRPLRRVVLVQTLLDRLHQLLEIRLCAGELVAQRARLVHVHVGAREALGVDERRRHAAEVGRAERVDDRRDL